MIDQPSCGTLAVPLAVAVASCQSPVAVSSTAGKCEMRNGKWEMVDARDGRWEIVVGKLTLCQLANWAFNYGQHNAHK